MYDKMKIGVLSLYGAQGKIKEYDINLAQDAPKIDFKTALAILTNKIGNL